MFGKLFDTAEHIVDAATKPLRDGAEVVNGLTEGEIRTKAATRLGADVVAGMSTTAVVEYLFEEGLL